MLPLPAVGVAHTPDAQSPLAHSALVLQDAPTAVVPVPVPELAPPPPFGLPLPVLPSGPPEPPVHVPFTHVPLPQSWSAEHVLPLGAPWPLPTQMPLRHTWLLHDAAVSQAAPPGSPNPAVVDAPQE